MEPLDPAATRLRGAGFNQPAANALALVFRCDGGIQEKAVDATITDDFREADQPCTVEGAGIK